MPVYYVGELPASKKAPRTAIWRLWKKGNPSRAVKARPLGILRIKRLSDQRAFIAVRGHYSNDGGALLLGACHPNGAAGRRREVRPNSLYDQKPSVRFSETGNTYAVWLSKREVICGDDELDVAGVVSQT